MRDDFAAIRAQIAADPENAEMTELGWAPVFSGSSTARVAIVGQAPGRRAQESGTPFDDASGDRLVRWLGVSREEFHDPATFAIVPMDFYFPGKGSSGDAPPRPSFAPRWHPLVFAALAEVRLTILVGAYAQRYYLGDRRRATLTETVRTYRDYLPGTMPIVHPSGLNARWLAANPWFEAEVVPELRELVMRAITTTGREQPGR